MQDLWVLFYQHGGFYWRLRSLEESSVCVMEAPGRWSWCASVIQFLPCIHKVLGSVKREKVEEHRGSPGGLGNQPGPFSFRFF